MCSICDSFPNQIWCKGFHPRWAQSRKLIVLNVPDEVSSYNNLNDSCLTFRGAPKAPAMTRKARSNKWTFKTDSLRIFTSCSPRELEAISLYSTVCSTYRPDNKYHPLQGWTGHIWRSVTFIVVVRWRRIHPLLVFRQFRLSLVDPGFRKEDEARIHMARAVWAIFKAPSLVLLPVFDVRTD